MSQNSVTPISRPQSSQEAPFTGRLRRPAVLDFAARGEAGFFLQFGGQAAGFIDDLRALHHDYPLVRPWIESAIKAFSEEATQLEAARSGIFSWGTDVLSWITKPETTPPASYLVSPAVSQPLIFVAQIGHLVHLLTYGCRLDDLRRHVRGATGHSQGVMSAVLFASAENEDELKTEFLRMVRYFAWQGLRMHQAFPDIAVPDELLRECQKHDWGTPSPMASINGLTPDELAPFLKTANARLPKNRQLTPSLINGWRRLVVSGSPEGLVFLRRILARWEDKEKSKPFFQARVRWEFLSVQGPYHSPLMAEALAIFRKDMARLGFAPKASALKLPVFATDDGRDLRDSKNLAEDLAHLQFVDPVDWAKTCAKADSDNGVTHVVDFGPSEMASTLTFINREGNGVVVVPYGVTKGKEAFLSPDPAAVRFDRKLWRDFAPKLSKLEDGSFAIDNAYVRFTGKPPIFGGGMTPTTVEADIVAAAANAGYLVEWAGGGQVTEAILRQRTEELARKLNPGEGFVFNSLYLDSYLWGLHYPLLTRLKAEGYPIDGVTISAGVPTREKATEILATFKATGFWCNAFKPGSDDQIRSVLEIADDHPGDTLLIQIEGGKAGGHHSWEDLYGLIERNYAAIRRRKNLVLCVGGGIASEEEAVNWLSGMWHVSGRIMPVDAVFLGTRLMACLEAKTSPQIKKLLAQVSGTQEWVGRGEFKGGVTSGQSQLGADVHYADNAASRTAQLIDEFSKKEEAEIFAAKEKIVAALEKTAKPYFGDLETMTYQQVLARLAELFAPGAMPAHIPSDGLWFDVSYRYRFRDFALRTWERFGDQNCDVSFADASFDEPKKFLSLITKRLLAIATTVLHAEDIDYFFALCRKPGKPVNFVPVIDKNIKRWFKSDSLWQAHDPRYSAEQALTIPGTLAIKGIRKANEPVADIFSEYVEAVIGGLKKQAPQIKAISAFPGSSILPAADKLPSGVTDHSNDKALRFVAGADVNPQAWLDFLAAQGSGVVRAALQSPWLTWGKTKRENAVRLALFPENGASVSLVIKDGKISALNFKAADGRGAIELVDKGRAVEVTWMHPSPDGRDVPLTLTFVYNPRSASSPLVADESAARQAVSAFYRKLWLGDAKSSAKTSANIWQEFTGRETVTWDRLCDFVSATAGAPPAPGKNEVLPGLSIALLWRPLAECLFQPVLGVDFLRLLHLSNSFSVSSTPLQVGDVVTAKVRLIGIINERQGRTITVEGKLERDGEEVITLTTRFLIRVPAGEDAVVEENHFKESVKVPVTELVSRRLSTRSWFQARGKLNLDANDLEFVIAGRDCKRRDGTHDYFTTGEVRQDGRVVGLIAHKENGVADRTNSVRYFLKRFGATTTETAVKGGFALEAQLASPMHAGAYALSSSDLNPIHTDPRVASLANLPIDSMGRSTPIIHGMWTSAAALAALSKIVPEPVTAWHTDFVGMVLPGERLTVSARQVAARAGRRIFDVTVTTAKEQTVLTGRAEIAQKPAAYVFTGQGSQATGMGMAAYEASAAARAVWDRADRFCQNELGFSILKIVRDNPKEDYVRGERVFHPKGVLNLTQFAQVGLTVLAMAQIAELKAAGVHQADAAFAGHSLGEYAALSCAGIIPLESVISVVYQRGLTMQNYVPRDAQGRSPYAMAVVRPRIIGWSEDQLTKSVETIAAKGGGELYVVNYNIEGMQYSITGRVELLEKLEAELKTVEQARGVTKPSFIWIEGVDVPFHSQILKPGVDAFRETLEETIPQQLSPKVLVGRYVPNLNAELFELTADYAKCVADLTGSSVLKKALATWPDFSKTVNDREAARCARLLLIELLAYQFASPVQWIKTQKVLLNKTNSAIGRVVEIGPSSVLANMMRATIAGENPTVPPEVLHFDSERDAVFGHVEKESVAEVSVSSSSAATSAQPAASSQPAARAVAPSANVPAPTDRPYALDLALRCLLALKLNIRPDEIRDSETIEALSGGNSARRNEILSEIGAEFQAGAIDDAHQMPFAKLAATLVAKSSASAPGPILQKAIDRALKEKVGLGKKDVLDHLAGERLLPAGLQQSALAFLPTAARSGVSTRSGPMSAIGIVERLGDRGKSIAWLDDMADAFGAALGFAVPRKSAAGAGGESLVSGEALSALENKYFGGDGPFAKWARELSDLCGWNPEPSAAPAVTEELEQLKVYKEAFGPAVERVATSLFDVHKVVSLRSAWNWVKRDLVSWAHQAIRADEAVSDSRRQSLVARATPELQSVALHLAQIAAAKGSAKTQKSLESVAKAFAQSTNSAATASWSGPFSAPQVVVSDDGQIEYNEPKRAGGDGAQKWFDELIKRKALAGDAACLNSWRHAVKEGSSFAGKVALITGAAPGSIAWEAARHLLAGGASVVATTSSYSEDRLREFRKLYQDAATTGAELHVLPFSQGSRRDVDELVSWCFAKRLIPDILLPFAAVGESATLTMMTPDASTATLRVLLQGVEWLIAAVARGLRDIRAWDKPCLTLLPLSPNHGVFGGDGAYADAKLGLEALLHRWHSEKDDWGKYVSLVGTTIGWVRGTGLMSGNNLLAATMEAEAGVRTFSSAEAGFLLASLCCDEVAKTAKLKPLKANFTGGFETVPDLAKLATRSRQSLEEEARLRRELAKIEIEEKIARLGESKAVVRPAIKASCEAVFPALPSKSDLKAFERKSSFDPQKTVVVVGYAEVSPFGSSKPRFDIECDGELSIAGAIELAWIMGLIRYEDGTGRGGYVGWVDAKSSEPIADDQIGQKFRDVIHAGTGVRFTDPEIQGFDPRGVIVFGDVVLENALSFTVESNELAEAYRKHYGDAARIEARDGGFQVSLPKGAIIKVPRRASLSRWVAGQIPKGWDATRFGVPKDLATQIDRTTLYNLVSSAQAFDSAGLTPQELGEKIAPSLIANSQGGGMGGMTALTRIYHDLREDKPRQGDALQETLINVGPAWVTQSFTGGYGPTVNPVAACATALVSFGVGCDLIREGKAEFAVAGGYDDYSEEGVTGFQDMAATCDTAEMLARGISPRGMSRPNDARRGGFVEAQGGGTLLLTTFARAVELGLPMYGVLAFANNYSDGVHTSIPAPGLGLLAMANGGKKSPLGRALTDLGLSADDITVVSKHDTSTAANDPNENKLHTLVQRELGRSVGHLLLVHSQKATLGHAKGGAGSWQAAAALQMLTTGRVPGNPNLEDVDPAMRVFDPLCFSDITLDLGETGVTAVMATSLGFGHVGAAALFVHPNFVLAKLSAKDLEIYRDKRATRELNARRRRERVLIGKEMLFTRRKERPTEKDEINALLGRDHS